MKHLSSFCVGLSLAGLLLMLPRQAKAQNLPPPVGAILDLAGQTIPNGYAQYSVDFLATLTNTDITFAFRNDPYFTAMDDVVVQDLTNPSGNIILNGGFETGDLTDWTYSNSFGVTFGGVVNGPGLCANLLPANSGSYEWCDGAVQGYDAIDQTIPTTIGDQYQISFWMDVSPNGGLFQQLSTNGDITDNQGNGIDTLVYAQAGLPPAAVPEPASLFLMGTGLLACASALRRKLGF